MKLPCNEPDHYSPILLKFPNIEAAGPEPPYQVSWPDMNALDSMASQPSKLGEGDKSPLNLTSCWWLVSSARDTVAAILAPWQSSCLG